MWLHVTFDIPVETAEERRAAAKFRHDLMGEGFQMHQYSVYLRHCPSSEVADKYAKRVKSFLPKYGKVSIIRLTDKQFGDMETYYGAQRENKYPNIDEGQQLTIFDFM